MDFQTSSLDEKIFRVSLSLAKEKRGTKNVQNLKGCKYCTIVVWQT